MMEMLEEGTTSRSAIEIAEQQERLGASIGTGADLDSSSVSLTALTANLAPSLELMADIVRNPAFAAADVARVKDQRLAAIAQEKASPFGLATRAMRPLIYGPGHPYGSVGGLGNEATITALTPALLSRAHARWLRPDTARIAVVGDITMAELLPQLEASFGNWKAPGEPAPVKNLAVPLPAAQAASGGDRPAKFAAIGAAVCARAAADRRTQNGQEALDLADEVTRRRLPLAAQHGSARGQGLELWRGQPDQ